MSLQFWQNRLSTKRVHILFFLILISPLGQVVAQTNEATKRQGILGTLENLIEIQKKEIKDNPTNKTDINFASNQENIKDLVLTPRFLRSILFSSEHHYLNFIKNDECLFYAFLENNLLKSYNETERYEVKVLYKDLKQETLIVSRNNFFQVLYTKKCFTNNELSTLFDDKNLKKTIDTIQFTSPKGKIECHDIFSSWGTSPYIPYLCKIPIEITQGREARIRLKEMPSNAPIQTRIELGDKIRRLNFYEDNLNYYQTSYLQNLCDNLNNQENFCKQYSGQDAWAKILVGELDRSSLEYKCRILSNRSMPLKIDELRSCAAKLKIDKDLCLGRTYNNYLARFPSPNCESLALTLSKSRLKADYQDCPGMVDNEGIVNLHRIINHFEKRDVITSPETCANESNYSFAKLNIDFNNPNGWPLRICYQDKIENKEICLPFIPGENSNTDLAETHVITQIIKKIMSVPHKTYCKLVDNKTFSPVRLHYQSGCFIVYDPTKCTTLECPKKIFVDLKEITELKYQGFPTFDYFPSSFTNEKFSISNIITESLKIIPRTIRNLTELTTYLDSFSNGIIHGIGCIEDILPTFKKRTTFNECTPHPFIIDGYHQVNDETFVIFRSSLDDVHSPRMIPWNFIFGAVSSYRELHPRGLWTFYGIKK